MPAAPEREPRIVSRQSLFPAFHAVMEFAGPRQSAARRLGSERWPKERSAEERP